MVANMSALQLAKRALVTLLLALARQYNIVLEKLWTGKVKGDNHENNTGENRHS